MKSIVSYKLQLKSLSFGTFWSAVRRKRHEISELFSLQEDFFAVELIDGSVRVSWDLGGGVTHLTHPLNVSSYEGGTDGRLWFHVRVQRSVQLFESKFDLREHR